MACPICKTDTTLERLHAAAQSLDSYVFLRIETGCGSAGSKDPAPPLVAPVTCAGCGCVYSPRAEDQANEYRRRIAANEKTADLKAAAERMWPPELS
jgi:hypothetical protein